MHRILYFHHGGAIGGAPLSLLFLLQKLDRSQYEPVVVTTRPGPVRDLYRQNGIEVHLADDLAGRIDDFSHTTLEWYHLGYLWPLPGRLLRFSASVNHARAIIRRFQPDLIHLNSSTLAVAAIAAQRMGIPSVWHIREPLAQGYFGLRRTWLRRLIDGADRIVAISDYDASMLIPSDRIRVIYNFVDFTYFDRHLSGAGIHAEFNLPPEARIILMLGGVAAPKGTEILVRALPRILERHPNVYVLIAGPAPLGSQGGLIKKLLRVDAYQEQVLNTLSSIHGSDHLIFTGVRSDIPRLLAASEMLVFPSIVPHFARPVIEAAAMAKPAVASNLGGPAELIIDGETGLLVQPNQPDALADAITRLLDDPELAATMGEAGYLRAMRLFNAERNAAETLAIYEELLGGQ